MRLVSDAREIAKSRGPNGYFCSTTRALSGVCPFTSGLSSLYPRSKNWSNQGVAGFLLEVSLQDVGSVAPIYFDKDQICFWEKFVTVSIWVNLWFLQRSVFAINTVTVAFFCAEEFFVRRNFRTIRSIRFHRILSDASLRHASFEQKSTLCKKSWNPLQPSLPVVSQLIR